MSAEPRLPSRAARWWAGICLTALVLTTFYVAAAVGAREAGGDQRVLPSLDPVFTWIRTTGQASCTWVVVHSALAAWVASGLAVMVALAGVVSRRRHALPLVLLAAAVSLASWGQHELLANRAALGALLYLGGMAAALALGVWWPLARLGTFPVFPDPIDAPRGAATGGAAGRRSWLWEYVLVYALTLVALGTRLYALTELPQFFDLETVGFMVSARTLAGVRSYLSYWLIANNNGVLHIVTQTAFFHLFGTSDYTVRLAAVFWGVVSVPLLYAFVRRLTGVGPAVIACVLLITAPEQLFWSRTENNFFIDETILALVSAHLGLWMIQRLSWPAVLVSAVWMPFCRYFYTPGMAMFLYPIGLAGHAMLFVRRAWRRAWYVIPLLAGGVVLLMYSLSFAVYVGSGEWHFVNPTQVYGAPVWRKMGHFATAGPAELVRLQAVSMTLNLADVIEGLTYRVVGFSHWYSRADCWPGHPTVLNVGVVLMGALAVAYLLGQAYDRRAFALLLWVAVGLAPGLLSDDPAPRRLALMFPGLYAAIAVFVGALLVLLRRSGGAVLARAGALCVGVAVGAVAWSSFVSHLLMPIGPTWLDGPSRFLIPPFTQSDLIFHNLDPKLMLGFQLDSLDHFVRPDVTLGIQAIGSRDWLDAALDPRCTFTGVAYDSTMPPARVEAMRAHFQPKRISFVVQGGPGGDRPLALLRHLFPRARAREYNPPGATVGLATLSVESSDVSALRAPSLRVAEGSGRSGDLAGHVLAGVTLTPDDSPSGDGASARLVVQGGIRLPHDGWYRFGVQPPCAAASFSLDQQPAPTEAAAPLTAGVHPFEVRLSSAAACALPVRLLLQAEGQGDMAPIPPVLFTSPAVAAIPEAHAPPVAVFPGYAAPVRVEHLHGTPVDVAADAQGHLTVLLRAGDAVRVVRVDPQWQVEATWPVQAPPGEPLREIHVAADGATLVAGDQSVRLYDRGGAPIGSWAIQWPWTADVAFRHDGRILAPRQYDDAIGIFDRRGRLEAWWRTFAGGPGKFQQPVSITVDPDGRVVVLQSDGEALLFSGAADQWPPTYVRSFPVSFKELPVEPRGGVFDGADRLLVPDPAGTAPLTYDGTGTRLMAANPARDLSTKDIGTVVRVAVAADRLYMLDGAGRLWSAAR